MRRIFLLLIPMVLLMSCQKSQTLKVLQFNIWQEGTKVPGGYEAIVQQIVDSKADLIAFSEVRNYNNTRFCDRIVKSLADRGEVFYSYYSYDSGILSRFPILDSIAIYPEEGDHGSIHKAIVNVYGREIAFYSGHLDYLNCAYYMVKGYDGSTWEKSDKPVTDVIEILKVNVASERDDAIQKFIEAAKEDKAKGRIVIIGGDFNEPSHLDWVEETKYMFDRQGVILPWTVTTLLENAGYVDTYREKYPNPVTHPGITYPTDCKGADIKLLTWAPDSDERERIDYLFYAPAKGLSLNNVIIWGPKGTIKNSQRVLEKTQDNYGIGSGIWPSDHNALLATFTIK